jgi:lipopolysaccharide transport protein LptA
MKRFATVIFGLALGVLTAWGASQMTLNSGSATEPEAQTTILSQTLEMISSDTLNTFYFTGNVQVDSSNLRMTADKMVVLSARGEAAEPKEPKKKAATPLGTIQKIVAAGGVHIFQKDKEATSGRAEFFPGEGKMVLTDNPKVTDNKTVVSGWRITLYRDQRRAVVEQDPNGSTRPSVDLSSLPGEEPDQPTPAENPITPPAPVHSVTLP